MIQDTMLHQFSQAFIKAVKLEMDSMKQRLGSFELPVTYTAKKDDLHELTLYAPSEKLSPGMQCSLRSEAKEYSVEINELSGTSCLASCRALQPLAAETKCQLVIYPWFLYEKLISGIEGLWNDKDAPGIDLAFKVFGKLKALPRKETLGFDSTGLNQSQAEAVEFSLGSDVSYIWGPPGTGKTHTLARLLDEYLSRGRRVLVVSAGNGAVDTVIDKMVLSGSGWEEREKGTVVRLGKPHPEHNEVNIDAILNRINGDLNQKISLKREEAQKEKELNESLADLVRFLEESDDQMNLFGSGNGSLRERELEEKLEDRLPPTWSATSAAGKAIVIKELMRESAARRESLLEEIRALKKDLIRDPKAAVSRSRLLFSTMAALYTGNMMEGETFDVAVIEEAGMAVLPALFYSITRAAEKAVIVGDPMQLPPVVQSREEYVRRAMGRSIYQVGLEDDFSDATVHLLDTQYRMHPDIGHLISSLFYRNRLKNGISPADREETALLPPEPGQPVCLVDLAGSSSCRRKDGSFSRTNPVSADHCLELLRAFPSGVSVALITPYADQARTVQGRISLDKAIKAQVECNTVHRFQGQERDVVILDLTDAPPLKPGVLVTGEYGRNLLNVALSRARGKLIVLAEKTYFLENAPSSPVSQLLEEISR